MKKRNFICCMAAFACLYFAACENQIMRKWWEEPPVNKDVINIAIPVIRTQPQSAFYAINSTAQALTIEATINGNGVLSYEWYSNTIDDNSSGVIIPGVTGTEYTPPTDQKGVFYYYVIVTNTMSNNNGDITTTATVVSRTAVIGIDVRPVKITGLSAQGKVYDGTTTAAITGTPILEGVLPGDVVTVIQGAADFEDANAGKDKRIIFSGWSTGGANGSGYLLQMPNLKADITKADPIVKWPSSLAVFFGQTLSKITLPGNGISIPNGTFSWTSPSDVISGASAQSHNMIFTPNDALNYNTLTFDVAITVVSSVKMVSIPDGTFLMGSPAGEPNRFSNETLHQVNLNGFSMSEHLVTQELYKAVMGNNPSYFNKPVAGETETPDKLPVEQVSWYDALVFCNKLSILEGRSPAYQINNKTDPADWGAVPVNQNSAWDIAEIVPGSNGYRLPTEAQWEYACRANTMTAYNNGASLTDDTGWYANNSGNKTHEIGLKPPNDWGLYDMHGNVMEWCSDWYYYSYQGIIVSNPMGPQTGTNRIARGGHWGNSYGFLRSAWRNSNTPYTRSNEIGIRLVLP